MKQTLPLFLVLSIITISACAPQVPPVVTPVPAVSDAGQVPVVQSPTAVDQPETQKSYTNSEFGLSFKFPSNWFGPDEYMSDQTLRVEVGSDKVYPYGTSPEERIYKLKNSYSVVIQYSKNDQNQYWKDTYQSLLALKDGESLSDARSLIMRVRELKLGRFHGIEYISTLSKTAQTEPVYIRQVILLDEQSNLLTIMGQPVNVEISNGANWREVYRSVDEANLAIFHQIVESITVE